jgi:hypothetical protein
MAVKAQMAVYELKILEEMIDGAVRRAEETSTNAKAARMWAEAHLKMSKRLKVWMQNETRELLEPAPSGSAYVALGRFL